MMKTLNVNPERIERDHEELARIDKDMQELPAFQNLTSQTGGAGGNAGNVSGPGTGGDEGAAEISALSNPTSSLAGLGNSQ